MKQVTRLIGPRRAAKSAAKEAASYNAISSPSSMKSSPAASSASAPLARVHNYGRVKSSPTGGTSLPSSSSGKIQYAALNRIRKKRAEDGANKFPRKSKLRRLFCWKKKHRQRNYQDYWSSQAAKPKKSVLCCCRWGRKFSTSSYAYDSEDEDDDIDAKVAAYVVEMKQREAVANRQSEDFPNHTSTREQQQQPEAQMRSALENKRRAWTWDDSLRSNSDRFLETLEEDLPESPSGIVAAATAPGGRMSLILHRRTPLHVTFMESEERDDQLMRQDQAAVQGRRHSCYQLHVPCIDATTCFPSPILHL